MPKKRQRRSVARARSKRKGPDLGFELDLSWEHVHKPLFFLAIALFGFGAMMIISASAVLAVDNQLPATYYFVRQLQWLAIGLGGSFIVYQMPLKTLSKSSVFIMFIALALLFAVLFVGTERFGARRWISLGAFDLQASEVAKLGFIIYLSAWLARARPKFKNFIEAVKAHFLEELVPFALVLLVVSLLIVLQPDLDTAVIIAATALVMYYVSGKDIVHSLGTFAIILVAILAAVFAAVAAPYRLARVQTYVNFITTGEFTAAERQDSAFQIVNSLTAIAEGGFFGKGFTQSTGKLFYLSDAAFTDSIYSVMAEEFGFVGSLALILAFLYFMNLGIGISRRAPDKFSALLAIGVTSWITIQAFLNIGANLAIIPFGGIPLPFLSYGGSSTLVVMAGVALLLNVHRHTVSTQRKSRRQP